VTQVTDADNPPRGRRWRPLDNGGVSTSPTVYRLAPAVVARLVGLALVAVAVLLFVATAVVALAGWSFLVVVAVAVAGVAATGGLGWWLRSRAWVLRCTDDGYRVRLVRGVGVAAARWSAVEDAVTTYRHDVACLQLRLRDGRTTTIPVGVLGVDKDALVRELQGRLQRGHGLRPLRRSADGSS
jgi:hypothetical protein